MPLFSSCLYLLVCSKATKAEIRRPIKPSIFIGMLDVSGPVLFWLNVLEYWVFHHHVSLLWCLLSSLKGCCNVSISLGWLNSLIQIDNLIHLYPVLCWRKPFLCFTEWWVLTMSFLSGFLVLLFSIFLFILFLNCIILMSTDIVKFLLGWYIVEFVLCLEKWVHCWSISCLSSFWSQVSVIYIC